MGLLSKFQRAVLRRHNKAIVAVLVLLVCLVGYYNFYQDAKLSLRYSREKLIETEPLDVFVVSHNTPIISTRKEQPHPTTTAIDNVRRKSADLAVEMERSKSKLHISDEGVLSPSIIRIIRLPAKPFVEAGNPLFITCTSHDPRSIHNTGDSPYLNFELPQMSPELESEVIISYKSDVVLLTVDSVKKGHEGEYRCVSQSSTAVIRYNTVEVRVSGDEEEARATVGPRTDISQLLHKGEEQQRVVDAFCQARNFTHESPQEEPEVLYRHLLLNDKTNTLFCFVPKAGCTNLKVLFFVAIGVVPRSQLTASRDQVNQELLEEVQFAYSFLSRSSTQRDFSLRHYFKFIMYRNPLERLLSGYRSKVERFPLIGVEDNKPHYNWLRKEIWAYSYPDLYKEYVKNGGLVAVNISFSNFINYWLTQPESLKIDEHFRSIFSLCEPCRVRYDFYGNFNTFSTDSQVLINKINSSPEFLRSGYYTPERSTAALTKEYYRQLSEEQRLAIAQLLQVDLEFYHQLFPAEENIIKQLY